MQIKLYITKENIVAIICIIINSEYIKNIHTSPYYKVDLEFQPEEEISVSRDRVKDFKDWLSK